MPPRAGDHRLAYSAEVTTNGHSPGRTSPGTASSLRVALRVVNAVLDREASGRTGFNVSRIADEVGIERSKASRTTQDLCDKGFLERGDDSTLRAGNAFFTTAASLHPGLLRRSRPPAPHGRRARRRGTALRARRRAGAAAARRVRRGLRPGVAGPGESRHPLLVHRRRTRPPPRPHRRGDHRSPRRLRTDRRRRPQRGPQRRGTRRRQRPRPSERRRRRAGGVRTRRHRVRRTRTRRRRCDGTRAGTGTGHIRAALSVVGREQDLLPHEEAIRTDLTAAAEALGKRSTATACPGSVSAARVARDARPACLPEPLGRRRRLVR